MRRGSRAAGRWSGLCRARLGRIYYAAPLTPPNAPLPPPNLISSMRADDDESSGGEGHAEDEDNAAKRKIRMMRNVGRRTRAVARDGWPRQPIICHERSMTDSMAPP
jgi:hypothetical protein